MAGFLKHLKYIKPSIYRNNWLYQCNNKHLHMEHLKNRSLIEVEGTHVDEFLQGMITNDIRLLDIASSIFTMFLNVQGRVLFDSFIYKIQPSSFIIECDSSAVQPLINHLKLHKVRRKLNFKSLDEVKKVCVLFDHEIKLDAFNKKNFNIDSSSLSHHCLSEAFLNELPKNTIFARDCRLHLLGDRLLLPVEFSLSELSNILVSAGNFKILRYKLGIGEGPDELIRGKCLPLETNCDYLHGVSFEKGCYIGQELTARTYHTGVIRKRHMPLVFSEDVSLQPNINIVSDKGKSVGKVIINEGKYGIGLMRIAESLESSSLKIGDIIVNTFKPGWWPE